MTYILPERQPEAKFPLGQLVITTAASEALSPEDVAHALARHSRGDWGDVVEDDRTANQEAIGNGIRLFSVYHDRHGVGFWVITEADRSATTVLLPDDY
jgi:hypothetical protein